MAVELTVKSLDDRYGLKQGLQVPPGRRKDGNVELGFGHLRKRAFVKLAKKEPEQWGKMPVDIRTLSDEQMAMFALEENLTINRRASAGDRLQIVLDGILVGHAELVSMGAVLWEFLNLNDARRGGFDTLAEMEGALRRAGYRFKPLNDYQLFRIQFTWRRFMSNEKLNQQRIRQLLQDADDKWYAAHSGQYSYHDHLDFVAIYIAKNYNRKAQPQAGKSR